MSRIGKLPITIPANVNVELVGQVITVKGPKGESSFTIPHEIDVKIEDNTITVTRRSDEKQSRSLHGTVRKIIANHVEGVVEPFKKTLLIEGVGYRFQVQGNKLIVNAGYSQPTEKVFPEGVTVEAKSPNEIVISGHDRQRVGQFAAEIRKIRLAEPYKGKGIRYHDEQIRRKEGKVAK